MDFRRLRVEDRGTLFNCGIETHHGRWKRSEHSISYQIAALDCVVRGAVMDQRRSSSLESTAVIYNSALLVGIERG